MHGEEDKYSPSNAVQNDEIRRAIDSFDFPQARLLLREALRTAEVREKWRLLEAIRRHKQASDDFAISQQANNAALKLASEMVVAVMRPRSNNHN